MPTIEIVSLGCARVPKIPRYKSFGWIAGKTLESNRTLFQTLYDEQHGIIVHLGNKDMEKDPDGCWFAGQVMDWAENKTVFFPNRALADVTDLLTRMLRASPERRIIFATDYQFGGRRFIYGEIRFSTFLELHRSRKIKYNTLFYIRSDGKA